MGSAPASACPSASRCRRSTGITPRRWIDRVGRQGGGPSSCPRRDRNDFWREKQRAEQLALVKEEIRVSSLFNHPNLLLLLDHAIITVKGAQDGSCNHEACLLFPVHLDGTLRDVSTARQSKKELLSTTSVLQIFRQLCAGLKHMHSFDTPYSHKDVKPGNVLLTKKKGQPPVAILMDFGSASAARKQVRPRSEALQLRQVEYEFNFLREVEAMERIHTFFKANNKKVPVLVPRVVPGMATRKVVAMEFLS